MAEKKPDLKYTKLTKTETKGDESNKYYWTKDVDECVAALREKIEQYYGDMNRTGRVNLYRNSYFKFYQGFILQGELQNAGQLGELTATFENHYANLITHG